MNAPLPPQPQRELQPIAPPEEPWKHCGIDLICDMPANSLGFHHVLVVVCYLSKFVVTRALKTKTTREVLDNLQDIYLTFGVPQIIQLPIFIIFTFNLRQVSTKMNFLLLPHCTN